MTWWHYLLLVNVYLTLFFGFYTLFLRRETFFNLNRVYLVSAALLSLFIPAVQSSWIKSLFITQKMHETIYQVSPVMMYKFTATATAVNQLTIGQVIGAVYITGMFVLIVRFFYQLAVINWFIHQPKTDTTYSFFNQIKVEERGVDNDAINAHEQTHVRQWHSADILLLEAITILNWFNPVVYWYRNSVKYIHEFIADRDAIEAGTDKAEYAMLLLSQTFTTPPYQLVTPFFNHSLLKRRIQMLQKSKSQRIKLVKYGLSAPLFALMLVLSAATVKNSKAINSINNTARQVFSAPASLDGKAGLNSGQITTAGNVNIDELSEGDKIDLYKVIKQHEQAAANIKFAVNKISRDKSANSNIYTLVEQSAEFPGGIEAFYRYLSANIRYPEEARQKNIQGKVFATFIVEKDGSITGLKILRGISGGADEETLRLLSTMPKWNPGVQNGETVRQQYTVPINFALSDNHSKPEEADHDEVFTAVEQSADFPGGLTAFYQYLGKNINYPAGAREKKIQGKVLMTFVVEKDGLLTNLRILRDPGAGLGDEAIRVLKLSPKWNPGIQNGKPVREQYTVPVSFTLADSKSEAR